MQTPETMKIASYLVFFLFFFPPVGGSQVQDDFSDGNHTDHPAWQGDVAHFQVNSEGLLQLKAPGAGSSALFLSVEVPDSAVWELYFKMDFEPSVSNRLKIYLQSDSENLSMGNGYFLQIGEDGAADAIRFYRQDGGIPTLLESGAAGAAAASPQFRLKMTRQTGSRWLLLLADGGGYNFAPAFEVEDDTHAGGSGYFGWQCLYTSTRKDKFFFDDFRLDSFLPDRSPPAIFSAVPVSAMEVLLQFNEAVEEMSATTPSNYRLEPDLGEPLAVLSDALDPTLVRLLLGAPMANLGSYILYSDSISDLSGNFSGEQQVAVNYLELAIPGAQDLLITEIMADPTPALALPEVEFIELYNRSDKPLDLSGLSLSSGGTPQQFPAMAMLPGSYLLVCDDSKAGLLLAYGEVLGLPSFPSLTNSGDDLLLLGASGEIIHQVRYEASWYRDAQKAVGGWTLEMVNLQALCAGAANWRASEDLSGGTPGRPNSVMEEEPDTLAPGLASVFATVRNPGEVLLAFDEKLQREGAETPGLYGLVPDIPIRSAEVVGLEGLEVLLRLQEPLQPGVVYELMVREGLADCLGNITGEVQTAALALPDSIGELDLVINELLFNPGSGGFDFLEIYNRSGKVLDVADLLIGNIRPGMDTAIVGIEKERLLYPGEYLVFTENREEVGARYGVQDLSHVVNNELPPFDDAAGNVTLLRSSPGSSLAVIDAFDYDQDYHNALLASVDAVSLERVHPDRPSADPSSWQSAAASAGYATPAARNSQYFEAVEAAPGYFDLLEAVFTPDGDGEQDVLKVRYRMDKAGYSLKAAVFDMGGRVIKVIAGSELLATEGWLSWDGDTEEGGKAGVGVYILGIHAFHPDGSSHRYRAACVLAGNF
jgi:hypothetical protein